MIRESSLKERELPPPPHPQWRVRRATGELQTFHSKAQVRKAVPGIFGGRQPKELSGDAWEQLADELADIVEPSVEPLSEYAASRAGIYEGRP